jgi:hypothetical protein
VNRVSVTLDHERAEALTRIAQSMGVEPATAARVLLSHAIDATETPDVAAVLDRIPGAFERAERGREQARRRATVSLDEF